MTILAALLTACHHVDSTTAPRGEEPCAGGGSLPLSPLSAATFDCSAGTTVTLDGGGASYLVAAQLAAADMAAEPVGYRISVPVEAVTTVVPLARAGSPAAGESPPLKVVFGWGQGGTGVLAPVWGAAPRTAPGGAYATGGAAGTLRRGFDAALRALGAELAPRAAARREAVPLAPDRAFTSTAGPPAASSYGAPLVGTMRGFQVLATVDFGRPRYTTVMARLTYAGRNVLLYMDQATPAGGFSDADLARLGQLYDEVLYALDVATFGPPSDLDMNGRVIMLLTPVVNALASASGCATQGFIGGFFNPNDLAGSGTTSNRGEIFYAIVPDPAGTVSCAHTVAQTQALLGGTFLHELQHLISYSQHVLIHHGSANDGWLDEGMSLVAEELGSLYYEARYPGSAGRSQPDQLLPDSAQPFMANVLAASYAYLGATEDASLTTHSYLNAGSECTGGDWLLLRWLADQRDGAGFFRALEQTAATGATAIEQAAGESFPAFFGDFALALYADSLPGIPGSAVPVRYTFPSRALRRLYEGYRRGFPLEPAILTGTSSGSLLPGALILYRVRTTNRSTSVVLRFSSPAGVPLPAKLRPQLSIFRLPDG